MKKLLPLAALTLFACNKPKCWTCTTKMYNNVAGTITQDSKLCDKTKSEIKDYENIGTYDETYVNANGDTIHRTGSVSCKVAR